MKRLLIFLTTCSILHSYEIPPYIQGHSMLSIRSQSTNGARKAVVTHPQMRQHKDQIVDGFLTISPSYSHSMRSGRLALALWGSESFTISGSQQLNRRPYDLLADYFGLSQQYFSEVYFKPIIQTFQCVVDWYGCFDKILHGLYLRIYAPFVWTQWHMGIQEDVKQNGLTTPFVPGYMDVGPVAPPAASFREVLRGTTTFGQMQQPLAYGKVGDARDKYGVSDVQFIVGYDILRSWRGHLGAFGFVGAPTGTRPRAEYFFDPEIGNGKHWELGGGFMGYVKLWERDSTYELGLYGDLTASTLLSSRQQRSFDIKTNRNLSRYMLVKQFDSNQNYTGSLTPLINQTTLDCHVHINLQFDIVAMLSFSNPHVICDIGYNGWIRTKERIKLDEPFSDNTYGLKGIQNVVVLPNTFSNATQSSATIYGNEFLTPSDQISLMDDPSPVLLTRSILDLRSGASPYLMTHKAFASVGYRWNKNKYINPLLSIGGEIEFEGDNPDKTVQQYRHTLTLWSAWLKGGFIF